jgi:glucose/arabinose dehydrogenase/azurin
MRHFKLTVVFLLVLAGWVQAAPPSSLQLKKGDHIALVGGAFADRIQHSGYLETFITAKHPSDELVFRNLAVAGDEVVIRHRSENFGSPDDWLKRVQADVVLVFFGYNESFHGPEGVEKYKSDLETYVKHLQGQNYSGKGAPRVVLFSPAAQEKHRDPNFPDPKANNANIQLYAQATAEVAQNTSVLFVDLYKPSLALFDAAAARGESLTVNGVYFTEAGDKAITPAIYQGLFGVKAPDLNLEKLRAAVNEKNAQWHARYRTVDGYNVYGGRSQLVYNEISNYKVMQEEMSVRDTMTANRDRRVWGVAQGRDPEVDDSNLPQVTKVPTNKKGDLPDGSYSFLSGEKAIEKMTLHPHLKVNLFASEEQFPELANPVQMAWDTKGRLWVAVWPNYPERTPDSTMGDSLIVLEDTDGDGRADKVTHFVDDLNAPTGFQFYKDGVLLMQAPDVWFLRDTDGDGKADTRERVLMGMDSADSHHTANAIDLDPGGAIYLSDGVFHRTQVETAAGPVRNDDAAIYRFDPRKFEFERYVAYGFANPHGKVFDYWGNDLITDATGNNTYFAPAFSGAIDYPHKHPGMKEFWDRPSRPCPGTGMISSRHFPEEMQGNFLNLNVISFQGCFQVKVTEEGSGLKGQTIENLFSSTDPNFRPSAICVGPDGALYFTDWQKPLIGHMQHHLRDPNRDKTHGRVYRITYEGRPLLKAPKIDGQPIEALLELLKEPENGTRELAKVELGARDTAQVIAATKQWAAKLDTKSPDYAHQLTEALWVHQWHNVVDTALLEKVLHLPSHQARAAATRVLGYWRDRIPNALALLKPMAEDSHPRVRLEAVRVASYFRDAQAAEIALAVVKQPTDYYLDYTLGETLRQLEPQWRKAIADGKPFAADNAVGVERLIGGVSTPELVKLPQTTGVLAAILHRADASDADRAAALVALAQKTKQTRLATLLGLIDETSKSNGEVAGQLARLLPTVDQADLKSSRAKLQELTSGSHPDGVRRAGWAALAIADGSFATIWPAASKSVGTLGDLLNGIPVIPDSDFRAKALPMVKPLLGEFPADIAALTAGGKKAVGRYVRVELPRQGTLTLAEVQVTSDGQNIARSGKATQSSTSNGGSADRAIDGRTDGSFGSGTQTHSIENENNPWWEVDLGSERPIDSVTVWNRTDADLGKRLEGYTLTILAGDRHEVFSAKGQPAPAPSSQIVVGGDPVGQLRRAAIAAAISMGREPEAVFAALTRLIAKGEQVTLAAQGIRTLPRANWPKTEAGEAAKALVAWARQVPASGRTAEDYIQTVQTAGDLAGLLPSSEAASVRKELRDYSVSIFVIRTVREQMRYDTPRVVVQPGKAFKFIIENADFMPHNLVVVKPGIREKIGIATANMRPDELDGRGRPYLPKGIPTLAATKLIESGQRATLEMTAPEQEGDYEYVCTYPGHWTLMYGTLVVTKDIDGYLAAHPVALQAAGPKSASE